MSDEGGPVNVGIRRRTRLGVGRESGKKMIGVLDSSSLKGQGAKKAVLISIALLFVYSIAIYSKSLQNEFVWDTVGVILEDRSIRDLGNVPAFFNRSLVLGRTGDIGDGLAAGAIQYYRPLLSTFHALEFAIFGVSPVGYKAANLLLNGLVVVLSFLVVRHITGSFGIAAVSAFLFASVPARAEAVYWVYSDSHILSALFSLLAFWAYLRGRMWMGTLVFIIGLLFQEGGVVLPMALFAYEGTRRGGEQLWARFVGIVPFALVSMIYLVSRHFIVGKVPTSPLDGWSLLTAVGYQSWEHVRIFLMPDASVTVYRYANGLFSPGGSASVIGIGALVALAAVAFLLLRFRRDDAFWYLWFLVWIAVSFNVGSYGGYLKAEKTLYLASLGLSVLMVRLLLSPKRLQPVGMAIICGLFLFNSTQVYARADSWANTATYLAKLLEFEPEFDLALVAGANTAHLEGRYQDSAGYYLRALRLRPDLAEFMEARYVDNTLRWAEELTGRGDGEQAIQVLESAVEEIPENSRIHNGMGVVYYLLGERERARKSWNLALQFDPDNFEASQNMKLLNASR